MSFIFILHVLFCRAGGKYAQKSNVPKTEQELDLSQASATISTSTTTSAADEVDGAVEPIQHLQSSLWSELL